MSLHREDRELQIRLAELQADVQIYTTASFAILAVCFTMMIGFEQIYFGLPEAKALSRISVLVAIVISAILAFVGVGMLFKRTVEARNEMRQLRKQFVW